MSNLVYIRERMLKSKVGSNRFNELKKSFIKKAIPSPSSNPGARATGIGSRGGITHTTKSGELAYGKAGNGTHHHAAMSGETHPTSGRVKHGNLWIDPTTGDAHTHHSLDHKASFAEYASPKAKASLDSHMKNLTETIKDKGINLSSSDLGTLKQHIRNTVESADKHSLVSAHNENLKSNHSNLEENLKGEQKANKGEAVGVTRSNISQLDRSQSKIDSHNEHVKASRLKVDTAKNDMKNFIKQLGNK